MLEESRSEWIGFVLAVCVILIASLHNFVLSDEANGIKSTWERKKNARRFLENERRLDSFHVFSFLFTCGEKFREAEKLHKTYDTEISSRLCLRFSLLPSRFILSHLFHRNTLKVIKFHNKFRSCKQGKMHMLEQKTTWSAISHSLYGSTSFSLVRVAKVWARNFLCFFSFVLELEPSPSIADTRFICWSLVWIEFWRKIPFGGRKNARKFDKKLSENCVTWNNDVTFDDCLCVEVSSILAEKVPWTVDECLITSQRFNATKTFESTQLALVTKKL